MEKHFCVSVANGWWAAKLLCSAVGSAGPVRQGSASEQQPLEGQRFSALEFCSPKLFAPQLPVL